MQIRGTRFFEGLSSYNDSDLNTYHIYLITIVKCKFIFTFDMCAKYRAMTSNKLALKLRGVCLYGIPINPNEDISSTHTPITS